MELTADAYVILARVLRLQGRFGQALAWLDAAHATYVEQLKESIAPRLGGKLIDCSNHITIVQHNLIAPSYSAAPLQGSINPVTPLRLSIREQGRELSSLKDRLSPSVFAHHRLEYTQRRASGLALIEQDAPAVELLLSARYLEDLQERDDSFTPLRLCYLANKMVTVRAFDMAALLLTAASEMSQEGDASFRRITYLEDFARFLDATLEEEAAAQHRKEANQLRAMQEIDPRSV